MPFSPHDLVTDVAAWHEFYAVLGGAAATLMGLLFVVISLNVRAVEQGEQGRLHWIASQTFNNFVFGLLLSLDMLIPAKSPAMTGYFLLVTGISGVGWTISVLRRARRRGLFQIRERRNRRLVLPLLGHVIIIFSGVDLMLRQPDALYLLVSAVIAIIASGLRNAWDLLFRLGSDPIGDLLATDNAAQEEFTVGE